MRVNPDLDKFPTDLEGFINAVASIMAHGGQTRAVAILASSEPEPVILDFDNWNGGTYTWNVVLHVDRRVYSQFTAEQRGAAEEAIRKEAEALFKPYDNHSLNKVIVATELKADPEWRQKAMAWIAGQGVTNQGRVRSDNIASREHDGLLFRSQAEINLYKSLKSLGISFAPLPVFVRGGEKYRRIEPDFVIVKNGVMMVVEVDGDPCEKYPGRRYIGICAPGRRLKASLIRVYVAFLCSAQALYEQYGVKVDPWMTLVGYFNSMRELGGMRRLADDDVQSRSRKMDRRGLAKRSLYGNYLEELTSRMKSEQIPQILDRLEAIFDPQLEAKRKEMAKGKQFKNMPKKPLDVLLATNMISVGVDVKRLGLMIVGGQPKSTAEYIQATSRVGRKWPGIVLTVFNWARPRDLSHYETFEHYHACFYKHVESLSVTPFAPGALSRGLAGLLVSLIRLRGMEFNANEAAAKIQVTDPYVQDAIEVIAKRAAAVGDGQAVADFVRAELSSKVDLWKAEAQNTSGGRTLTYSEPMGAGGPKRGTTVSLLRRPGLEKWEEFTCLNSLRDVEPNVKLIIDDGGLDEQINPQADQPAPADKEGQE